MKTVTFKLYPFLAKFLAVEYKVVSPWKLTTKIPVGQLLESIIKIRCDHKRIPKEFVDAMSFELVIEINDVKAWTATKYMSPKKHIILHNCIKSLFYDKFRTFMVYARDNGSEIDEGIKGFMLLYQLTEDDIKIERLRKHYNRHIK